MYKITMEFCDHDGKIHNIDMPLDTNLEWSEAAWRCEVYKKRSPKNIFRVINMNTKEVEWAV